MSAFDCTIGKMNPTTRVCAWSTPLLPEIHQHGTPPIVDARTTTRRIKQLGDNWDALHKLVDVQALPQTFGDGEGKSADTDRFFDFPYPEASRFPSAGMRVSL